jgi:hydrogenase expression/formation protein HypC
MCLGVPGKVLDIYTKDDLPMGKVDFGGLSKEICLAYTPEVRPGDYVLVHVGFAINAIDETEAEEVFTLLRQYAEAEEAIEDKRDRR